MFSLYNSHIDLAVHISSQAFKRVLSLISNFAFSFTAFVVSLIALPFIGVPKIASWIWFGVGYSIVIIFFQEMTKKWGGFLSCQRKNHRARNDT